MSNYFRSWSPSPLLRDNGNGTPGHPGDIRVTGDHWSVQANPGPLIGQATEVYALLKSCVNAIPSRSNDDSPCVSAWDESRPQQGAEFHTDQSGAFMNS